MSTNFMITGIMNDFSNFETFEEASQYIQNTYNTASLTSSFKNEATTNNASSPYKILILNENNRYLRFYVISESSDLRFENKYLVSNNLASVHEIIIGYNGTSYGATNWRNLPFNFSEDQYEITLHVKRKE